MLIGDIIGTLEQFAPPALQENYDNCGLLTGNPAWEVSKALLTLDATEAVIDEAIANGCNLVIAHHPIIFSGLKKINGKNYVERTIIKAIKNDIAIYAIHTNLDNVLQGVNAKIAEKLGLQNLQILQPKKQLLKKLVVFTPEADAEKVRNALFEAGAGNISNYSECSFNTPGTGTFKGNELSNPALGEKGKRETASEVKIEVIFPVYAENKVLSAMRNAHPYEEVAFDIIPLDNFWQEIGSGIIGNLPAEMNETDFLKHIKTGLKTGIIRHTALLGKKVKKVAVCGGSGSFLLNDAIRSGADFFITADFKYHQFFDAEDSLVIADIGHYESEQFTPELIQGILSKKFPTFAALFSKVNTNPVNYF
jgi:dinuclear metal center YbgI/SA1388 family protein